MEKPPSPQPGDSTVAGRTPAFIARVAVPLVVLVSFAVLIFMRAASAWSLGGGSVLGYHRSADRAGQYVIRDLTWENAGQLRRDSGFDGTIEGHVYAQPLYWHPPGASVGLVIVATESNIVYALDATTGRVVWKRALGQPARRGDLPCGDIDPLGVTGTPVIDPTKGALYLDAMVKDGKGLKHLIFGLALRDGSVLKGWPVDVAAGVKALGTAFDATVQNQRGALVLAGGRLFVPYGGHTGDCGAYRGRVVALALDAPAVSGEWHTRGTRGGIWAPAGIVAAEDHLFVTTGNTSGAKSWADGEAVIRLSPELTRSSDRSDFFAPSDWQQLDSDDSDLGATSAVPITVHGRRLMLALGKDGKAYLLDRDKLGGIGGALEASAVSGAPILTAPATWADGDAAFVAFRSAAQLESCPGGGRGAGVTVLRIDGVGKGGIKSAWCRPMEGGGNPITTTSDGHSNRIVWIAGAERDDRLHGFRADNGEPVFSGGGDEDRMPGLRRFSTIVAANGRLYLAGDGKVYAFALPR